MPRELRPLRLAGGVAKIVAAGTDGDGKPRLSSFSGRAYTGAVMNPDGWGNLILDLAGAKIPYQHRPALRQHDHEQVVGHTQSVKVTTGKDGGVDVDGVFSGQAEHVAKVTDPAAKGFQWQMSIGGNPIRLEYLKPGAETEVNGRKVIGPLDIAREWELGEVSFVPLGADGDTSVSVSASVRRGSVMFHKAALKIAAKSGIAAARYSDEEIDKMSDEDAKAALRKCMAEDDGAEEEKKKAEKEAKAKAEEKKETEAEEDKKTEARIARMIEAATQKGIEAARKATAVEAERTQFVAQMATKYGISTIEIEGTDGKKGKVDFASHAIAAGWGKEKIELEALRNARPGPGVGQGRDGPLVYSTSTPEVDEAVVECAALQALRHGYKLEADEMWWEEMPDKTRIRRQPQYVEQETRRELAARYPDKVQQDAHTRFRGRITLHQALDIAMHLSGSKRKHDWKGEVAFKSAMGEWDYLEKQQAFRAEGASTIAISNILSNVQNKFALQGYFFTEGAWRRLAGIRPVPDMKPTKSVNLLGDVIYQMVGNTGELSNADLQDQAFPNQAFNFGKIVTIPWQAIVNDDLGILQTVPQLIGKGAGLALNDMFWSLWTSLVNASVATRGTAGNPYGAIQSGATITADDGNAFWRTTTNLPSGIVVTAPGGQSQFYNRNKYTGGSSALSATSLATAKAAYDNQLDPNGNPLGFDATKPILLFGPTNWQTARNLMQADLIVSGNTNTQGLPNKNAWNNYADLVLSRYIENAQYVNSTTAWWLLYDPVALPTIEVCFLNGIDTPAVLTAGPDYQFDRLGISIRGTMPFGVTQQNFRGSIYMAGA